MEICDGFCKIFFENQLNKSQIEAFSDIKKTSSEALQHIVNTQNIKFEQINDNHQNNQKMASIFSLRNMSARDIIQSAKRCQL
jgi:hypothetical protein